MSKFGDLLSGKKAEAPAPAPAPEPVVEAKRARDEENTSMNDAQHIEVDEFYSIPRIAPKSIGKYVTKSKSFDIGLDIES